MAFYSRICHVLLLLVSLLEEDRAAAAATIVSPSLHSSSETTLRLLISSRARRHQHSMISAIHHHSRHYYFYYAQPHVGNKNASAKKQRRPQLQLPLLFTPAAAAVAKTPTIHLMKGGENDMIAANSSSPIVVAIVSAAAAAAVMNMTTKNDAEQRECGISAYDPPLPDETAAESTSSSSLSAVVGGSSSSSSTYGVLNGHLVPNASALPWMATLFYKQWFICSATIVSSRYVLTAGHCVESFYEERPSLYNSTGPWPPALTHAFTVVSGTLDRNDTTKGVVHKSRRIIPHPEYTDPSEPSLLLNDLALVELETPLQFSANVRRICLSAGVDSTEWTKGRPATIAGWGLIGRPLTRSNFLHDGWIRIASNLTCERLPPKSEAKFAPEKAICVEATKYNICVGDSGGPLLVKTDRFRWLQIGITSTSMTPGVCSPLDSLTRVSFYCSWLNAVTQGEVKCVF